MPAITPFVFDLRPLGPSGSFLAANPSGGRYGVAWVNLTIPSGLNDLTDVTITSATSGQAVVFNGTQYVNADVSSFINGTGYTVMSYTGAVLPQRNVLNFSGSAVSVVDNSSNGRTDVIFNSGLNAIASLSTTGFLIRTGSSSYTTRSLSVGSKISITNSDGVAGNPTIDVNESRININNISGVLGPSGGGLGLDATNLTLSANSLLGVNNSGDGYERKVISSSDGTIVVNHTLEDLDFNIAQSALSLQNLGGVVPPLKGGTGATGLVANAVLIGNGTGVVQSSTLRLLWSANNQLVLNGASTKAALNVNSSGSVPFLAVNPLPRYSALSNTFEYDGTGVYYVDNFFIRYRVATTGDSLVSAFTGILPIAKGGTNQSTYQNETIIKFANGRFTGIFGSGNQDEVITWATTGYTVSSGGFLVVRPNTSSRNNIASQDSGVIPLGIVAASGQVTGLLHFYDNDGRLIGFFDKNANLTTPQLNVLTINASRNAKFLYTTGSIAVENGTNLVPSIYKHGNALLGINFTNTNLQLRDDLGTNRLNINSSSGIHVDRILTVTSGTGRSIVSATNGDGNVLVLPTGNGLLALLSQIPTSVNNIITTGVLASGQYVRFNGTQWINASGDPSSVGSAVSGPVNSLQWNLGGTQAGTSGLLWRDLDKTLRLDSANIQMTGVLSVDSNGADIKLQCYKILTIGDADTAQNKTKIVIDDSATLIDINCIGDIYCGDIDGAVNSVTFQVSNSSPGFYCNNGALNIIYSGAPIVLNGGSGFLVAGLNSEFVGGRRYTDFSPTGHTHTLVAGTGLTYNGSDTFNVKENLRLRNISAAFQGNPLVSGMVSTSVAVPYSGAIRKVTILGSPTGSILVDVQKCTYANYPAFTGIVGTNKVTVANETKAQITDLASWTSGVTQGDIYRFIVTSGNNLMTDLSVHMEVVVD